LLQRPSTVVPDGRHLLAVANPRYAAAGAAEAAGLRSVLDATELGQLPATAKEAIAIAKLFATPKEIEGLAPVEDSAAAIDGELVGERFRLLLGNRASERRLTSELLHQVSVLHFACHGHADAADPAFSYLALSDNGFLRVPDLARLHGDYELMTLSACDTAKGSTIGHDGLAGLARAGLAAGARHVLATLWPVQDQSTSDFVVDVYRRWLRDHESLANALRSAQRAAIVAGKDSRTWAAFVLWGADR
ncbi:MAG TPA: CHAT domain-containing protein, partial [Planctomycetota bacterium]|nr:CHAT domain-containing protein [Planctomycetota bacterium]